MLQLHTHRGRRRREGVTETISTTHAQLDSWNVSNVRDLDKPFPPSAISGYIGPLQAMLQINEHDGFMATVDLQGFTGFTAFETFFSPTDSLYYKLKVWGLKEVPPPPG